MRENFLGIMDRASIRVGVDVGGTFTDVAMDHPGGLATSKALTDYARPERAILAGIQLAAQKAGVSLGDIGQVIHGTTLVTNALIERRGALTAFVTTEGFRDVIEMRSENRFEQYDLNLELPKPLVPRQDRLTVAERVAADGEVLLPLQPDEADRIAEAIVAGSYESVAIGFMHSYANDHHERLMEAALRRAAPSLSISLSSRISPHMRELPRFNTVIANAYVRPQISAYLDRLLACLREAGIGAPIYMMHSRGGLISLDTAAEQPVRLLESGPAGGAIFAAQFARSHGLDKVVSFDMGGTTAKICLIEDFEPRSANSFEIARTYRFKKGSGMVVSTPVVEMVEIGAGGGSIAEVDRIGRLQVGPRSAASEPGPACYQRGGTEPTVTDANLVLGRLDPDNFANGEIPLSTELAEAALESRLSAPLSISVSEAAFGITEMVDENMANAARVHTIENGRDIEHFTMIAFGGGAPLHACRQCEKLGLSAMLVPPAAGVGSAVGFLRAPFSYETTRGLFQKLSDFDAEAINATLARMLEEADAFVESAAARSIRITAYMRYSGQGWEIPVELPHRPYAAQDAAWIQTAFESAYRGLFGRVIDGHAIEITNWSLIVASSEPAPPQVTPAEPRRAAPTSGKRTFYDAKLRKTVEAVEVRRADMEAGCYVDGPAAITEAETTTIVTSAFRAIGQSDGSLLLARKDVA